MTPLKSGDQTGCSFLVFGIGGFRGRSRISLSSSFRTVHQIMEGGLGVTDHQRYAGPSRLVSGKSGHENQPAFRQSDITGLCETKGSTQFRR